MSFILKTTKLVATGIAASRVLPNKYAKSFINKYFNKKEVDNSLSTLSFLNLRKHNIKTLENIEINAYEIDANPNNDYIFLLHGFNQNNDDFIDIINGFLFNKLNIVLIDNRELTTYGVKECFDLLSVIDYFVNLKPEIKICLFGEYEGANIIIKSLKSKMNSNVKCCIVDDPNTSIKERLLNDFVDDKDVNVKSLETIINHELKNAYNFTLDDLSLNNCLTNNDVPICFVYSKIKNNFDYKNLLKIYNQNIKTKKFYYTYSLNRNYEEEKYFETLSNFIKNYF